MPSRFLMLWKNKVGTYKRPGEQWVGRSCQEYVAGDEQSDSRYDQWHDNEEYAWTGAFSSDGEPGLVRPAYD
jgi:hypothetical protein